MFDQVMLPLDYSRQRYEAAEEATSLHPLYLIPDYKGSNSRYK